MPVTIVAALIACLLCAGVATVSAETVTLAGSGGMTPLLTALGNAYMKKYPHNVIKVSTNSLTQSGGILAAKTGAVDIGMSARPLETRELSFSIDEYHIADAPAEVAVHRNVAVTNLTSQQLCAIYAGEISNWREVGGHNARIIILTRPESDSTKQAFRNNIPCFQRLKETPLTRIMYKSNDMVLALRQTPDAIGLIDAIALKQSAGGKAHPLRLDGTAASVEALASGRWPVVKKYTLILRKNRSAAAGRFMRFIKSPEGAAVIRKNHGIPHDFSYP